jgi:Ca-activated chloride channel homolog
MMPVPVPADRSSGGRLVSTDGRTLPLIAARLDASARGGLAEVVLEQRFRNGADVPLTVTYSFPLPADAAVGGYAFTIGDRRITGEIDRRAVARERFEQALIEGKTAGLVDQERSSLFTQEVGNIPPGAEVVARLTIDQKLRWLPEGAWEWRFPTAAAPRYLGAEGRVPDADRVSQELAEGVPVRLELALEVRDVVTGAPESPSHRLRAAGARLAFADDGGVPLDRDVVVRWPVAGAALSVALQMARGQGPLAHGLLTLTPPAPEARPERLPRDLIVLLDTSGSMDGEPLAQARRVVSALIDTLDERDRLELVEFSTVPSRWRREPVAASAPARAEALRWLSSLSASGGTEMRAGIVEALQPLRAESQRQVVLVTDGLIGSESEVVGTIVRDLPASCRVHTVGVGSAVNRSLTMAAARAGRGLEVIVALGEDPERAARRLVAHTGTPLVVGLELSGPALVDHAPAALPDLFAGAPALVALALHPEGGALIARGRTASGEWRQVITVPPCAPDQGPRAAVRFHARERVEDLETRTAAGQNFDAEIERVGLEAQISTRLTSWIAVSEERTVDPQAPIRRVRMPQELPQGMSVEGLGLRAAVGAPAGMMRTRQAMSFGVTVMGGAPAPKARGGGRPRSSARATLIDALKKATGWKGESDDRDAESAGPSGGGRRFRGRVALRKGNRLVVNFEVDGAPLPWSPGSEVTLVRQGHRTTVAVVQATAAGTIRAGDGVRLVLELAESEPLPDEVLIDGPEPITIVLAA